MTVLPLRLLDGTEFTLEALRAGGFGARMRLPDPGGLPRLVESLERAPHALLDRFYANDGLLVIEGAGAISERPELLLRLSRLFGPEVENYRLTQIAQNMVHRDVAEILIVSNVAPVSRMPPARPEPPYDSEGGLPIAFPHRRGWHTDQSYRRPPPDVSLFYAVQPSPRSQGQTLYADGIAAYEALDEALKATVESLVGIHAQPGVGRSEQAVLTGEPARELAPHQLPQRQPVVRVHPVTGKRSLYLCESGQMDWIEGPFVDMEPGPHGAGAKLLYRLMAHMTHPDFVYVHEWQVGDLVIYDNRTSIHSATWFDAEHVDRIMWRTTVSGNPGAEYAGEAKSWLRESGC